MCYSTFSIFAVDRSTLRSLLSNRVMAVNCRLDAIAVDLPGVPQFYGHCIKCPDALLLAQAGVLIQTEIPPN